MQMRQRDVAAPDAKYTKELADASRKWCLRDDVAGRRRLHIVICQSVREAYLPPPWDNAASLDWQTPLNGIISPQRERLITMQKQLEGTQKYINEQYGVAHIAITYAIIVSTYALPAEYKCLK